MQESIFDTTAVEESKVGSDSFKLFNARTISTHSVISDRDLISADSSDEKPSKVSSAINANAKPFVPTKKQSIKLQSAKSPNVSKKSKNQQSKNAKKHPHYVTNDRVDPNLINQLINQDGVNYNKQGLNSVNSTSSVSSYSSVSTYNPQRSQRYSTPQLNREYPLHFVLGDVPELTKDIVMKCAAGHTRRGISSMQHEGCEICNLLAELRQSDPRIDPAAHEYSASDLQLEFVCHEGHHFMTDFIHARSGCRLCALRYNINKKHGFAVIMDKNCLFKNEHSDIRFHCNKMKHDPKCRRCLSEVSRRDNLNLDYRNPACMNFIPCDQDFYASAHQIRYVYRTLDCNTNHRKGIKYEADTTRRILEQIFDDRFDNAPADRKVDVTAYNERLKLACIHLGDPIPSLNVDAAQNWADANGCNLMVLPKKHDSFTETIVGWLCKFGYFDDFEETVATARGLRYKSNSGHKLFADRCTF